jgi:hypothetical protein
MASCYILTDVIAAEVRPEERVLVTAIAVQLLRLHYAIFTGG